MKMKTANQNNIVFVDLDTVTNVFVWDHQLTANLCGAVEDVKVGDIVFALRNGRVSAARRISRCAYGLTPFEYRFPSISVRMNLHAEPEPILLSCEQKAVLIANAVRYRVAFHRCRNALAISPYDTQCFEGIVNKVRRSSLSLVSHPQQSFHLDEISRIVARTDSNKEEKLVLCEALLGRGDIERIVFERDADRLESDHELDLVATRIVPWEACSDEARLDPDNHVLMDRQLAEHFSMGLVSFRGSGKQIQDPAMNKEAFDPWVDPDFCLPKMNERQRQYMAYHRAHIFKQWRCGLPKPLYAPVQ
jgi:hypothetical protein